VVHRLSLSKETGRLGFHPTGLFAPFGVTYLAAKLLELGAATMTHAAGIVGAKLLGFTSAYGLLHGFESANFYAQGRCFQVGELAGADHHTGL
jgi:hypothetical protein